MRPGSHSDHEELALHPTPLPAHGGSQREIKLRETAEIWGLVFTAVDAGLSRLIRLWQMGTWCHPSERVGWRRLGHEEKISEDIMTELQSEEDREGPWRKSIPGLGVGVDTYVERIGWIHLH